MWFDLAEGSFPYPSSYIPFALLHKKVNLPAWPMQAACWTSRLHQDWRIHFQGDVNQVRYNISYGDSGVKLQIDWDNVTMISSETTTLKALATSEDIVGLLSSVREAISIWHNVSKDVQCYNVTDAAPNLNGGEDTGSSRSAWKLFSPDPGSENVQRRLRNAQSVFQEQDEAEICRAKIKQVGSWEPVCCNDEMDLIITEARGLGRDFFWPPSLPRGVVSYDDLMRNVTMEPCPDPDGIFGYSTENYDPWSTWLDTYYGSSRMSGHSNIIFSNGLLDPWAAGGIYAKNPTHELSQKYDGSMVQNITDHDVIALIMEYGGHHTDLMYSHKLDPECVTKARKLEKEYVAKWINEW